MVCCAPREGKLGLERTALQRQLHPTDGLASDTASMHVLWTRGLSFVLVPYRMVSDTLSLSCRAVRCPACPPWCGFFP